MTPQPSEQPCYHPTLVTFRDPDGVPRIWACADCRLRFEPGRAAAPAPVASPLRVEQPNPVVIDAPDGGWPAGLGPVASPAPLDVERLARALGATPVPLMNYRNYLDAAEAIAAEYARLEGQPVAEKPRSDQEATP